MCPTISDWFRTSKEKMLLYFLSICSSQGFLERCFELFGSETLPYIFTVILHRHLNRAVGENIAEAVLSTYIAVARHGSGVGSIDYVGCHPHIYRDKTTMYIERSFCHDSLYSWLKITLHLQPGLVAAFGSVSSIQCPPQALSGFSEQGCGSGIGVVFVLILFGAFRA